METDALVVTIFHVGHGDCVLIQFPGGRRVGLVDVCRPAWSSVAPVINALKTRVKEHGPFEIAFVCVSHPHGDHVRGIADLLTIEGVTIKEYWHTLSDLEEFLVMRPCGELEEADAAWRAATEACYEYHSKEFVEFSREICALVGTENVRQLHGAGFFEQIDGVSVFGLNPCKESLGPYKRAIRRANGCFDRLDRSLLDGISAAMLFRYGENELLYASDMQDDQWQAVIPRAKAMLGRAQDLGVSVVKASHHGGSRSFYDGLWGDLFGSGEGTVVVSAGSGKHPSGEFVDSVLNSNGRARLLCTGKGMSCGHSTDPSGDMKSQAADWLHRVAGTWADYEKVEPCYGDLHITLPRKGPPHIQPLHRAGLCEGMRQDNP